MKGWHRENYRHSLAAKGIRTRISFGGKISDNWRYPKDVFGNPARDKEMIELEKKLVDPSISDVEYNNVSLRFQQLINEEKEEKKIKEEHLNEYNTQTDENDFDGDENRKQMAGKSLVVDTTDFGADHRFNFMLGWMDDSLKNMVKAEKVSGNPIPGSIKDSWHEWILKEKPKEVLVGGLADFVPDNKFHDKELSKGITVEMEHTHDPDVAKEIAKDHIVEVGNIERDNGDHKFKSRYYDKLADMERELEAPSQ